MPWARDILKKATQFFASQKAVRFRFVEEQRGAFAIDRLCRVMNVSPRGLRAFRKRTASPRQRMDMVLGHKLIEGIPWASEL